LFLPPSLPVENLNGRVFVSSLPFALWEGAVEKAVFSKASKGIRQEEEAEIRRKERKERSERRGKV
jgi:hypothetical protein